MRKTKPTLLRAFGALSLRFRTLAVALIAVAALNLGEAIQTRDAVDGDGRAVLRLPPQQSAANETRAVWRN